MQHLIHGRRRGNHPVSRPKLSDREIRARLSSTNRAFSIIAASWSPTICSSRRSEPESAVAFSRWESCRYPCIRPEATSGIEGRVPQTRRHRKVRQAQHPPVFILGSVVRENRLSGLNQGICRAARNHPRPVNLHNRIGKSAKWNLPLELTPLLIKQQKPHDARVKQGRNRIYESGEELAWLANGANRLSHARQAGVLEASPMFLLVQDGIAKRGRDLGRDDLEQIEFLRRERDLAPVCPASNTPTNSSPAMRGIPR